MTSLDTALSLIKIGCYVFPVNPHGKVPYKDTHGHLDASNDAEQIATWFGGEYPGALVGVHSGPSELICLDVDIRNQTGKNGYNSLGFLQIPDTYNYTSRSGNGNHYLFDMSDPLPPQNEYRGMAGVDRKSGSSYFIWASEEVPTTRDVFKAPPGWLLDLPEENPNKVAFAGNIDEWFESIPQGAPTESVEEVVANIPEKDFGHQDVLRITYRLVRMAAEGHTGIKWALDTLWSKWVKPPYDDPKHKAELWNAIEGAIRKAGEEDTAITELPPYGEALDKVSRDLFDLLTTGDQVKGTYFKVIKLAASEGLDFNDIATLVWNAPATTSTARDWGIEYLFEKIEELSEQVIEHTDTTELLHEDRVEVDVSILTNAERASIKNEVTFINRYVDHARTLVAEQNKPYDYINAWMVLSCAFADFGFIPRKTGPEPLNFYSMTLGETTSGKSMARKFKLACMYELHHDDEEFNIGGIPSPPGLSRKLVERDGKVSYYNKDEAHGNLKLWTTKGTGDWTIGILEDFAEIYDGRVQGSLRAKREEGEGKVAKTYFLMDLMGTPEAMIGALNRELFLTGFLARFQWAIGDPRNVTYDSMAEEDSDGDEIRHGFNPGARQLALELAYVRAMVQAQHQTARVPVRIAPDAAKRLQDAKWALVQMFEKHQDFEILEPSLMRTGVTIRKAASLLALSEGRTVATLRDVLLALETAEVWVKNLVQVAGMVSESDFQRTSEQMLKFIASKPSREVRRDVLMRRYGAFEPYITDRHIDALMGQGLVQKFTGEAKSVWYRAL